MVTRREFLKIAIVGAAGAVVGGAAGSYITGLTARAREEELQKKIKELEEILGRAHLEDSVSIWNWSWYINEYVNRIFEKDYGVPVTYDTFESDEEVFAKVSTGAAGYDVVVMADAFIAMAAEGGFLEPLDHSLIPNLKYIDDKFKNKFYDPGNQYSVPYMWGTTGIARNKKYVTDPIDGWEQLFDFDYFLPKYKGKITMLDDLYETIPAALKYLGYSTNETGDGPLAEAEALLIQQKKYLLKYASSSEYIPGLMGGVTYWVVHAWNGDVYIAREANRDVEYILPKEGGVWWIDNMCIPKGAGHPNAAHAWMNFISSPEVSAINSLAIFYATPNKESFELLKGSAKPFTEDPGIFTPDNLLSKFELGKVYTAEEREKLMDTWIRIKVAAV